MTDTLVKATFKVTEEDLAGLMAFYEEGRAEKGFEEGVRSALEGVLSSPFFLFRYEFEPDDVSPGDNYRLDDLALASRLAFLTASPGRERPRSISRRLPRSSRAVSSA